MGRSNFSPDDTLRLASGLFDEMVTDVRNRGTTKELAVLDRSTFCGISLRWAKKLLYGELGRISPNKSAIIQRRFLEHLDDQMAYHETEKQKLRLRLQQMKLRGVT